MNGIIFTEASQKVGFGHVTRCLALSQELRNHGINMRWVVDADESAQQFLSKLKVSFLKIDWKKNLEKALGLSVGKDIVLIDSYLAPESFYAAIYGSKVQKKPLIVTLDDYNRINYQVDMIVNPAIDYGRLKYKSAFKSRRKPVYLLGQQFVILRKDFWKVPAKKINKQVTDVLITLGGMNNSDIFEDILNMMLRNYPSLKYHVIFNRSLPVFDHPSIKRYANLNAGQMRTLMQKCDLCISAGGQTLYELSRTGIPTVAVSLAENQQFNLAGCQKRGMIDYIGRITDKGVLEKMTRSVGKLMDYRIRRQHSRSARKNVDGLGVKRIVREMLNHM